MDKTADCWLWTGCVNAAGYGVVKEAGRTSKTKLAHRLAYELTEGAQPIGMLLHTCDRPSCVRPTHLSVGTHADNMRDMARKERGSNTKLTAAAVQHIRTSGESTKSLAEKYGVLPTAISNIKTRRTWKHVA